LDHRSVRSLRAEDARLPVRPSSVREYTVDDISQLLESTGFSVVETETYESTFTALGRKPATV
jgi:hypothetical protein